MDEVFCSDRKRTSRMFWGFLHIRTASTKGLQSAGEVTMSAVMDCVGLEYLDALDQRTVSELVVDAQNGDRCAMEALIERHQNYVGRLASKYVDNHEDIAEVCQEVFILVVRRLNQLQVPVAFSGWLRSITLRTAINYCRRRKIAFGVEPEILDANEGKSTNPAASAEDEELKIELQRGLNRLNDSDRATLVAFYYKDQSLIEMAKAFDAPVGTIKRRLHVARKRLAEQLNASQAI